MPKGHAPKRETKKPKKKDSKRPILSPTETLTSSEVEVVRRKRKPKEEDF